MVLEHLFPENWLERRAPYAFLLAAVYTLVGIVLARLIFAGNSGIVSVVFASLLLIPSLGTLLKREERMEEHEETLTPARFWHDNKTAIKVYFAIFLGIYLTYLVSTFLLAQLGKPVGSILSEQLSGELRGAATSDAYGLFYRILINNWWVLLACFLLSLIAGEAAVFFIAWNASSWGTIFGYRAVEAGLNGVFAPTQNLIIIAVITLPHVILEGGAYVLATIAGGVLNDDIIRRHIVIERFLLYVGGAGALFLLLRRFLPLFLPFVGSAISIAFVLLALHSLIVIFPDARSKEVFRYNSVLFLLALLLFLVGAIAEVYVLRHATILHQVYAAAAGI